MQRSPLTAVIIKRDETEWGVEAINDEDSGSIELTTFSGPKAGARAMDYAQERYAAVEVWKPLAERRVRK